ncbi:acireductone synthase [Paracidobacterium acidisoli]|uniref:Enolase-phosphatase E1 n=1 Tax=Paracidobacterium acidisoli TaxID=2303751 RepID=A0A372IP58_9BACT|nr:acireductone synthase [Paracidobacterium acidisoli]MBT9331028.1 acireductone synthase [Paracidobacterium acidisoli]
MNQAAISVVLLDIEGTTTPVSFVYDVLFPYARARLLSFLSEHVDDPATHNDLDLLRAENVRDLSTFAAVPVVSGALSSVSLQLETAHAYLLWLMNQDRKSPALKSIQCRIWEAGYAAGDLHSIVFPDVPLAFERWREQKRGIAIYSSGSVLAQKLIFRHTQAGDLTPWIEAYFDTAVGPKTQSASYRNIASTLNTSPEQILFLSDAPAELDAASAAGISVCLAVRPGNKAIDASVAHTPVSDFESL